MSIPDYLFQSSNTFFRKASSKERVVNLQMTINSKKKLEQQKDTLETQRSKFKRVEGAERDTLSPPKPLKISAFPKAAVKPLDKIEEESLEDDLEKRA